MSLVPRARCVEVKFFHKCHRKDEWTLTYIFQDSTTFCGFVSAFIEKYVLVVGETTFGQYYDKTISYLMICEVHH